MLDQQAKARRRFNIGTLVERGRAELVLDALEMIEPLDGMIELRAFLFRKLGLHLDNRVGELCPVQILQRGRDVGQNGETLTGYLRNSAEHDDLLPGGASCDRQ